MADSKLEGLSDSQLVDVVVNYKKYGYKESILEEAKKIIKSRNVNNNLIEDTFKKAHDVKHQLLVIQELFNDQKVIAIRATFFYVGLVVIPVLLKVFENSILIALLSVILLVCFVVNFYYYYRGSSNILDIFNKLEEEHVSRTNRIIVFFVFSGINILALWYYRYLIRNRVKEKFGENLQ